MPIKPVVLAAARGLGFACAISLTASALAQTQGANFPTDVNSLAGDHIRVQTHLIGFVESISPPTEKKRCAPAGSGLRVVHDAGGVLTVRFYDVEKVSGADADLTDTAKHCKAAGLVSEDASYTIAKAELLKYDYKRSGVTFGGLVVPFKFRLGGDKAVTSSSTVAPYLGFTTRYLQGFGLSLNPVIMAGVGMVPVANPDTGTAETKTAFSFGAGFVLTSSKNNEFSAGLIIGRDVLSSADRARDPNVDKPWLSFYLGVSM